MYRPKNWEYQKAHSGDYDNASDGKKWDIAHSFGWRDGFEAGADAMLEALKKYPNALLNEKCAKECFPHLTEPYARGYWVFIPEGEDAKKR